MSLRHKMIRMAYHNPELRSELLPLIRRNAASEIPLSQLPEQQAEVVAFLAKFGMKPKPNGVALGIHGYIVQFETQVNRSRLDMEDLRKLTSHKVIRWIQPVNGLTVGM